MELSQRITGLTGGGSDGWDLFSRSRAMVADGIDVIELTIGEHDRRTEPEILDAMRYVVQRTKFVIEPSAATVFAALFRDGSQFTGARLGVIVSGGNVDLTRLAGV